MAKTKKWYDGHPNAAHYAKEEKEQEKANEVDEAARQAGTLIGRILRLPVADGYAVYIIKEVRGSQVRLQHMKWGDGYSDWSLGKGGWHSKAPIVRQIKLEDSFNAIFDRAKARQNKV